jgi:hypothetical protein
MLVNFLGVNLTKFAPPNFQLLLGVIFFFFLFSFLGVIAMVMKFPKEKKKN